MTTRLLSLDDPRAQDVDVAGSKAAALARARASRMPVLPGWIVPANEATRALRVGANLLQRESGSAYAAVTSVGLDRTLLSELDQVRDVPDGSLIVRSSSSRDSDPRWAGGFSTYHDVRAADLPTAVRGCWASVFTRHAIRRREELGERVEDLRIAVLLQPWVVLDIGGAASLTRDGSVVVSWARGGPAGLMSGLRTGSSVEISRDGRTTQKVPPDLAPLLKTVAHMQRHLVQEGLGEAIEWGARGDEILLLQMRPTGHPVEWPLGSGPQPPLPELASTIAGQLALLASRFPAPLGETLVLPWAIAPGAVPDPAPSAVADSAAAFAEARGLAERLTAQAWGSPSWVAAREAAQTFRRTLGPTPHSGLDRLSGLEPVDPAPGQRVVSLMAGIADRLVTDGRLRDHREIWRLSPEDLKSALQGGRGRPAPALGADRWEPFVFQVTRANGQVQRGTPISPGIGAGRVLPLRGPRDLERAGLRRVLVLRDPVPQAAPLLWGCAGLVTAGGGLGAHLFEVARSLGVPAVAGVDLTGTSARTLAAVDGSVGGVSVWTPDADARSVSAYLSA